MANIELEKILPHLKALLPDVETIKIIDKRAHSTWLIKLNNKYKAILKANPHMLAARQLPDANRGTEEGYLKPRRMKGRHIPLKLAFRKLVRRLNNGSLSFQNEQSIHPAIIETQDAAFVPAIICNSPGRFLLLEYLNETTHLENPYDEPRIASVILSLSMMRPQISKSFFKRIQFAFLQSPLRKSLLKIWKLRSAPLKRSDANSLIITLLTLATTQRRKRTSILIHNDLYPNNILINPTGRIFIIDFEDAIMESKWMLVDIIDVAFNWVTLTLSNRMLFDYLSGLNELGISFSEREYLRQIRFGLIRTVGHWLASGKLTRRHREKLAVFLTDIVNDTSRFEKWAFTDNHGENYIGKIQKILQA